MAFQISFYMLAILLSIQLVAAQDTLIYPQVNTWNSSFQLRTSQIQAANLSNATAHNVQVALKYERTNNAGGPIADDPFYSVPSNYSYAHPPAPGTILKVEQYTNTSLYTLPPSVSMTRFLYTTESLNGTSIPASAFILWPYLPHPFANLTSFSGTTNSSVNPIIGYAHGTSGQQPSCAISHIRNLWDSWGEPFAMALAGYAVVAPDYAGQSIAGIPSPYFVLPSQANDLYLAVAAAQSAFPDQLSRKFVMMGQSQGGGVAWSGAQRQHQRPVDGYLGTVAASPFTNTLDDINADANAENNVRIAGIAQGLDSVLDSFQLSDWLTPIGIARVGLIRDIGGCGTVAAYLFSGDGQKIIKPGWNLTSAAKWYMNATLNGGGRPFAGPMMVIQGTLDPNANVNVTTRSVDETCAAFPDAPLRYVQFEGIEHVPVLYAGQWMWLKWIEERFMGLPVKKGCAKEVVGPTRGVTNIVKNVNWFMELDLYGYE